MVVIRTSPRSIRSAYSLAWSLRPSRARADLSISQGFVSISRPAWSCHDQT